MQVIKQLSELRRWRKSLESRRNVGFVPTMGALHEGHADLVRSSVKSCRYTVVSIFVNPLQFGANEDFSKYPKTFDADAALLESLGVDVLWAPDSSEILRPGASAFVDESVLSKRLCGAFRPGHFKGVTTIVSKLFHHVDPDRAFFGQKDYQQCAIIRQMIQDLDFDIELEICPTVREARGLAMSSRNRYLSPQELEIAPLLYKGLLNASLAFREGCLDAQALCEIGTREIHSYPEFKIQYWTVADPHTLETLGDLSGNKSVLIALAIFLGSTRLIDNVIAER